MSHNRICESVRVGRAHWSTHFSPCDSQAQQLLVLAAKNATDDVNLVQAVLRVCNHRLPARIQSTEKMPISTPWQSENVYTTCTWCPTINYQQCAPSMFVYHLSLLYFRSLHIAQEMQCSIIPCNVCFYSWNHNKQLQLRLVQHCRITNGSRAKPGF